MFKETFLFILAISFSLSTSLRLAKQTSEESDVTEKNETYVPPDIAEDNTANATDYDGLFWTIPETNNTMEAVISGTDDQQTELEKADDESAASTEGLRDPLGNDTISLDTQIPAQTDSEEAESSNSALFEPNQKIVLQRNNCYLEIAVHETHDLKMQIMFDKLQNNSAGQCCITLNGHEDNSLGVIISNIHLYQDGPQGEVLKVIVKNHWSAFVLKEYYGGSVYQPLLLTEANRVYLLLHYDVKNVSSSVYYSYFNLEVFTYNKYENNIDGNPHPESGYYTSQYHY